MEQYSLVGLFALCSSRARATVMGLNDEGVLFLLLTVHQAACPQLTLTGRPIQHYCLKRRLQTVDDECTDFSCKTIKE